ncbi:MAG: acetate--CoA ligase family protein [Gammaproteobacteria bacterium]|nr:acetate--CoA ligase family protein [Gammaproteobacteria bacterium]
MSAGSVTAGPRADAYARLFHPASIVVVGASDDVRKPGGRVLANILRGGYAGTLWTVHPRAARVQGVTACPGIGDLPAAPDLAIIAVPAAAVAPALEALGRKGTAAAIVLSSGFGETGASGIVAERSLRAIAERAGMTLVGPNCSGILTPTYAGKFAGIIPALAAGSIDVVTSSGATVDYLLEQATPRGLRFDKVANLGNCAQTTVEDVVAMLDANHAIGSAGVLLLYMETLRDPQLLLQHARSLARKGCRIVAIKSGVSAAGERAAACHTGALATRDAAVQALFDKAGILRVASKAELIEVAAASIALRGAGRCRRVCIVTDAGGPGVLLTDVLARHGIEVPVLGSAARERLAGVLPAEASLVNPVDCLPSRDADAIARVLDILVEEERESIDAIVVVMGNSGLTPNAPIYEAIRRAVHRSPIPILAVLSSATTCAADLARYTAAGGIYFTDEVALGEALGRIASRPLPAAEPAPVGGYDRAAVAGALAQAHGVLEPDCASAVLRAAGIPVIAQSEVRAREDLAAACARIGYPLAIKAIGPVHKTEVGGVRVGIRDDAQAAAAWSAMTGGAGVRGVLVQALAHGPELILGAVREPGFGHLLMFGLGGIHTEVLADVRFALAPLGHDEALGLVRGIRGFALLEGYRGGEPVAPEVLAQHLCRLSRLVTDFPRIAAIDLNPMMGTGTDLHVVDARIVADATDP